MYPQRDDIIYHQDPAAAVQTDEGPGAIYEPYAKRGKLQIKTIFCSSKMSFHSSPLLTQTTVGGPTFYEARTDSLLGPPAE